MPVDPSARFRIVKAPPRAPGNCFICKGVNNGPFIDPGLEHEYYREKPDLTRDGNVYICTACIKDMYHTLQFGDPEVERRIADARRAGIEEGSRQMEAQYRGFLDSIPVISGVGHITVSDPPPTLFNIEPIQDSPGESDNSTGADSATVQDDGDSSGEGPDGVSSDRDNDVFAGLFD